MIPSPRADASFLKFDPHIDFPLQFEFLLNPIFLSDCLFKVSFSAGAPEKAQLIPPTSCDEVLTKFAEVFHKPLDICIGA